MTVNPIELAITEASSRGLRIERLPINSKQHTFDRRLLLIEGRRCQVIPSRLGHPSEEYPDAEYLSLYLPRGEWPDYLIYVLSGIESAFWIVPRGKMSKDTGRTPQSMEPYREAWDLLRQGLDESPKQFEVLNWQLEAVKASAQEAGLQIELIPTKKYREGRRWPPVVKTPNYRGGEEMLDLLCRSHQSGPREVSVQLCRLQNICRRVV